MERIDPRTLRITRHVRERLDARGITLNELYAVLASPETSYPNPRHPGQYRLTKGHITVVVDIVRRSIPTVLYNKANDGWKAKANHAYA
jgi:hypothetical protein